jgi:hypothetical protein
MLATFAASKIHNFKHLGSIGNSLSNTCNKWRSWKLCKELWNSPPQQHLQQVKKELETLPRNSGIHPATTATSGFVNSLCQRTLEFTQQQQQVDLDQNLTLPRTLPLESFHRWHNHPTKVQSMKKKKEREKEIIFLLLLQTGR